jgi:methylase of polypeptide subunit release factors
LDLYRRLFQHAPQWLAPNGMMLLEIEATQGPKALSLAYDSFDNVNLQLRQDLAGKDRMLVVRVP